MPDKIEVRNGSWKWSDLFYLGATAFFVYLASIEKENKIVMLAGYAIFGGALTYFGYQLLSRFNDKSVKIEFSDFGIVMHDEEERIPWSRISKVEISRGRGGLFDFINQYLTITIEKKSDIDVETFDVTEYAFKKEEILAYCRVKVEQNFDKTNNSYTGEDDPDENG